MFFIKASILCLYHRIFFVSRRFRIMLWAVGIFVLGYSVAQTLTAIFACVPIPALWDPSVKGRCLNVDLAATIMAAFNVLTDFAILILPMPMLWQLQIPTQEKLQIMGIFLLGGFVCFASIYRTVVIHQLSLTDPSWSDVPAGIWTAAELGVAIISSCLPTFRPLFSRTLRKSSSNSALTARREMTEQSNPSLSLEKGRSNPAQSASFAHLGVLGDPNILDRIEKGGMKVEP